VIHSVCCDVQNNNSIEFSTLMAVIFFNTIHYNIRIYRYKNDEPFNLKSEMPFDFDREKGEFLIF